MMTFQSLRHRIEPDEEIKKLKEMNKKVRKQRQEDYETLHNDKLDVMREVDRLNQNIREYRDIIKWLIKYSEHRIHHEPYDVDLEHQYKEIKDKFSNNK